VDRTNNQGCICMMAKPCSNCLQYIYRECKKKNYVIHRIYYTNEEEDIDKI